MPVTRLPSLPIFVVFALLAFVYQRAVAAEQISIYRCAATNGAISLQDHPCPPSAEESLRRLQRPNDPLTPPRKVDESEPKKPVAEQRGATVFNHPSPMPPLWLCRDFDGAERESTDGAARGRYVPLWVVGRDPYAPGQLFGRVGEPLARPNMAPPGRPPTQVDSAGSSSSLIYVSERCYLLRESQRCTRFAAQRRELERKIFNSQSTDRAILAPQSAVLRKILIDHCAG